MRHLPLRSVIAVVALIVSTAPDAGAQSPRWLILAQAWVSAVTRHVPGEMDQAVQEIARWPRVDLELVRPYLAGLAALEVDGEPQLSRPLRRLLTGELRRLRELATLGQRAGERHRLAMRGALMHTDVVTLVQRDPQVVAPPRPRRRQSLIEREETAPRVLVRVPDGELDTFRIGPLHWDIARDLLTMVDARSEQIRFVRHWYRAVAAYFAHERNLGEGGPHLQEAVRLFPRDAGILFALGCLNETLGSRGVQEFLRTATLPNGLRILDVDSGRAHVIRAEHYFRQSVDLDPALVEARVRLGRTLGQLDRHAEGAIELRRAAGEAGDPTLRFYAELFRGDEQLALGHLGEAEAAYERAATLFPGAQSAHLALSFVARQQGDRSAALARLLPSLSPRSPDHDDSDPWREYFLGEGRRVRELFAALYEPFRAEQEDP